MEKVLDGEGRREERPSLGTKTSWQIEILVFVSKK